MTTTVIQGAAPVDMSGYLSIRQAMRHTGWSNAKILRHSLIGECRSLVLPGRLPMFNAADLDRIKEAEAGAGAEEAG